MTNTPAVPEPSPSLIAWRRGTVESLTRATPTVRELLVAVRELPEPVRAVAYVQLVGAPEPGDEVLLNVTAQKRGLGTGGVAFVIAVPDRLPPDPPGGPGHIVKGRYLPHQAIVLGVDEQESPHHALLAEADSLAGMPVVVADLHSSLPAVIAGARQAWRDRADRPPKVAYIMTDGGALPAWFSHTVTGLREAGWIDTCITAGQALGGDLEATTVHSALLAAHLVVDADLAVVTQGPGNLGTGTRWGFSGVATGEALNATATLGGQPIAALRISQADRRTRHQGVSHHSLTTLDRVALAPVDIAVPVLPDPLGALVRQQVQDLPPRHRTIEVPTDNLLEALRPTPVRLSTMGRRLDDDPAAFLAAAASGVLAALGPQ